MAGWSGFNAIAYRLYATLRARRRRLELAIDGRETTARRVVHLNWGLIGDTVLTTAALRHYRAAFAGCEIVCVGREPVRCLVAPHVDRFVPFDPDAADLGPGFAEALRGGAFDGCELLTGDVHVFYGGLRVLADLIARLPARRKVFYEGYADRRQLAPSRRFPPGVEVVPSLRKGAGDRHVLHDVRHFFAALTSVAGAPARALPQPAQPIVVAGDPGPVRARLLREERAYVACQLASNNPKKDWPVGSWARVFAALPGLRFVLLGSARDRGRTAGLAAANVVDLCGRTELSETIALIAGARAFVGIDSGLAHIAAALGVRTCVVAQNATLGWFFPYPDAAAHAHVVAIHNEDSPQCVGCVFACPREPIWEMARRGARCLRELPPERVARLLATHAGG